MDNLYGGRIYTHHASLYLGALDVVGLLIGHLTFWVGVKDQGLENCLLCGTVNWMQIPTTTYSGHSSSVSSSEPDPSISVKAWKGYSIPPELLQPPESSESAAHHLITARNF